MKLPPDQLSLDLRTLKFVETLLNEDIQLTVENEDDTQELALRRFRDKLRDIMNTDG